MTVPTPPDNPVSNYVVSLLRTWVPVGWGALLAWAATQLPALEPYLNSPGMAAVGAALAGVLTGVWYWLWRSVEKKLPAWLTRLVLGANRPPNYNGQVVNRPLTPEQRAAVDTRYPDNRL